MASHLFQHLTLQGWLFAVEKWAPQNTFYIFSGLLKSNSLASPNWKIWTKVVRGVIYWFLEFSFNLSQIILYLNHTSRGILNETRVFSKFKHWLIISVHFSEFWCEKFLKPAVFLFTFLERLTAYYYSLLKIFSGQGSYTVFLVECQTSMLDIPLQKKVKISTKENAWG